MNQLHDWIGLFHLLGFPGMDLVSWLLCFFASNPFALIACFIFVLLPIASVIFSLNYLLSFSPSWHNAQSNVVEEETNLLNLFPSL
mmetsp:Transcript_64840/g.174059  ORF Transcript_64840/g.174059 Transcript_64840/m.174059 type:complete len:86 (-) Transcript_64840:824-1081(-)